MYIDAHAHFDKYDLDLDQALSEVERYRILTISVSMDPESYAKSLAIESRTRWVISTFGIHPWNAPELSCQLDAFQPLIDASPMLGEIGLDYYWVKEPAHHELQRGVFIHFVKQGAAQDKILNIHTKGAEADVDRILGELTPPRVIVHWYSGPLEYLFSLAEKGVYFTVGVEVLLNSQIQAIAKAIPASLLLTESDNPAGYRWLTGDSGMPSIIPVVVKKISELRGWTVEETRSKILDNFIALVRKDAWAEWARSEIGLHTDRLRYSGSQTNP